MARRKDGRPRNLPVYDPEKRTVTFDADSPIVVPCPACYAAPGEPCTQPTNTSRKPVAWFHLTREEELDEFGEGD